MNERCPHCHLAPSTGHYEGCPDWTPETHAEVVKKSIRVRVKEWLVWKGMSGAWPAWLVVVAINLLGLRGA